MVFIEKILLKDVYSSHRKDKEKKKFSKIMDENNQSDVEKILNVVSASAQG